MTRAPLAAAWPAAELESVPRCPLCGSGRRSLVYEGLRDRTFFSAPGVWSLHSCAACGLFWLDPRPSEATLGEAYASYYTHEARDAHPEVTSRLRALSHDYLNVRYGYDFAPARPSGRFVVPVFRGRRERALRRVRHLRRPGSTARLLDIGCGDGTFLAEMRRGGWVVEGIEPDARAAEVARSSGFVVHRGALGEVDLEDERFDAATMNHVLEHLRDPLAALREVFRILKPGGEVSISTPNAASTGSRRFGSEWVHLDPPRHLVLFTPRTLRIALERSGFLVRSVRPTPIARWTFAASAAVAAGVDPFGGDFTPPRTVAAAARVAALVEWLRPALGEEVAVVGRKPP